MNIQRLVKYIESHGHKAHVVTDGVNSWIEADASFTRDSSFIHDIESVKPTFKSVREWLGY